MQRAVVLIHGHDGTHDLSNRIRGQDPRNLPGSDEAHAHGGLPDTRGSCDHHEARAPSHQHLMESTFHEACDHRLTEQRVSTSEAWTDHERERADEHRR